VDAAPVRLRVVDVREEIPLDIEDGAEFRRAGQAPGRQGGLADEGGGFRQPALDVVVRGGGAFAAMPDDFAQRFQAGPGAGVEDQAGCPRVRVQEDEGLFLG
jgi:hypothetical protein